MTINDHINNFLRDAQYRIGTLSVEIDNLKDKGSYEYRILFEKRLHLSVFMDIVYEGKWYIIDGYNHIQYITTTGEAEGWTEKEVIREIEHLRYYTDMNEVPFITFTAHYPQIINLTGSNEQVGSGGSGLPVGTTGQIIFYNASGIPYTDSISPWAGMNTGESINSYFSGRP